MHRHFLSLLMPFLAMVALSLGGAHAQESSPVGSFFESLGKLIQGKAEEAPAAAIEPADAPAAGRNLQRQGGQGGRRVALIIGNGAYRAEGLKPLANPANDAEDMAAALRRFNFEVLAYKNLGRKAMRDVIAEFGRVFGRLERVIVRQENRTVFDSKTYR